MGVLGRRIQEGAHCSIEDAGATMELYRREEVGIEAEQGRRGGVGKGE